MRIYNRQNNKALQVLLLFFPLDEAKVLAKELERLISEPNNYIINFKGKDKDGNLTKELLIRIYNKDSVDKFDEKVRELIIEGKAS
jgi:hypothetical protein